MIIILFQFSNETDCIKYWLLFYFIFIFIYILFIFIFHYAEYFLEYKDRAYCIFILHFNLRHKPCFKDRVKDCSYRSCSSIIKIIQSSLL